MEQYDRELLYQQVWDKPMLKVAEEYGISSVALGKICRRLGVPFLGGATGQNWLTGMQELESRLWPRWRKFLSFTEVIHRIRFVTPRRS